MNKKKYLALDAICFSLRMFRKHCYSLLKLSVVAGLLLWGMTALIYTIQHGFVAHDDLRMTIAILHDAVSGSFSYFEDLKSGGLITIFIVVLILIFAGISDMIGSKIALILYDDKDISFKDVISCMRRSPSYFGAVVVASSATRLGGFFLILGLLMELRLNLCRYFVVDKNASINQALRGSYGISKGHMLDIFMASMMMQALMVILIMLSNILGLLIMSTIIAFMIVCYTTFTCVFINSCVYAFFYRRLLEEKEMKLAPAHVINEDSNQIPKSAQETLQQ